MLALSEFSEIIQYTVYHVGGIKHETLKKNGTLRARGFHRLS